MEQVTSLLMARKGSYTLERAALDKLIVTTSAMLMWRAKELCAPLQREAYGSSKYNIIIFGLGGSHRSQAVPWSLVNQPYKGSTLERRFA